MNVTSLEDALEVLGQLLADRHLHYEVVAKGLTVYLASRFDQICFKLYASVDQGPKSKHFADLCALNPKMDELHQAKEWCTSHDASIPFAKEINQLIENIYESS